LFRHIRWQLALIVVGVLLLGGLLTYLAVAFTIQREPAPGGTYVEGVVGSPQFVNPLLCQYNEADRDLCALIFSGLIQFDEHGNPQPDLAERWDISPDGLIYTFHLRANARWHDDQPVTADDVVFTIQLLQDPNYPGSPDLAALWRTVQVVAVNSLTVQMTLQEPLAPFLQYATIGILPKHLLENMAAANLADASFNRNPIGTGPFQVETFGQAEAGQPQHVLLAAYPGYYGRQPFLAKIDLRFYPDFPSMLAAYRAGEIQGLSQVPIADLPDVRTAPTLNLYNARLDAYTMIFLNQGDDTPVTFFQDQRVRQALLLGLDRQRLIDEVLHGQGLIANSPIVPGNWAYASDLPTVTPDLSRARQLLNQAGWRFPSASQPAAVDDSGLPIAPTPASNQPTEPPVRVKDGIPISFTLYTNSDPTHVALAEAIARQWLDIGVKATVVPVQAGLVSNYLAPRTYQAALVDVQLPNDPDPYPFWHETQANAGQNYSQYRDRDLSEVLEQARRTNDLPTRIDLYHKFQQMFSDQVPGLLLYYPIYTYAVSDKVSKVQIGSIAYPSDRFRTISDWYVITRRAIVSSASLAK
jgi:peptide/nickel transport system substrate-binding protein